MVQLMETRMSRLEGAYEQTADRLNSMDGRLSSIDGKIDTRYDALDHKIDTRYGALDHKIDVKFNLLAGMLASSWITIILAVLFHR